MKLSKKFLRISAFTILAAIQFAFGFYIIYDAFDIIKNGTELKVKCRMDDVSNWSYRNSEINVWDIQDLKTPYTKKLVDAEREILKGSKSSSIWVRFRKPIYVELCADENGFAKIKDYDVNCDKSKAIIPYDLAFIHFYEMKDEKRITYDIPKISFHYIVSNMKFSKHQLQKIEAFQKSLTKKQKDDCFTVFRMKNNKAIPIDIFQNNVSLKKLAETDNS